MSVNTSLLVGRRPWGGWEAPLPAGTWVGGGNVVGDGTGGNQAVILRFQVLGAPRLIPMMVSLEQVSCHSTFVTARNWTLTTINMDHALADGSQWNGDMQADAPGVSRGTSFQSEDAALFPLFFSGMRETGTAPQFNFETENNSGKVFTVNASGYWWDAASRSFPGGPMRPVGSIFG